MVLKNTAARTPDRIIQFKKTPYTKESPAKSTGLGFGGGFDVGYKAPTINTPSIAKIVNNNTQLSANINKQVQDLIAKQKIDVPKITLDVVTKIQFSKTTNDIIRNAINGVGAIDTAVNKVKSNMPTGILQNASAKDLQSMQYIAQPIKTPTQMVQDAISGIKAVKENTLVGLDNIKFADNGLMQLATYEKDKILNITNQQIKINLLKSQGLTTKALLDKMETTNIQFTIAEPGKMQTSFTGLKDALDYYNTRKTQNVVITPTIVTSQYITIENDKRFTTPPKEYPVRVTISTNLGKTEQNLAFKTIQEAKEFTKTQQTDRTNYGVSIRDWTETIKDNETSPRTIISTAPIWSTPQSVTPRTTPLTPEQRAQESKIEAARAAEYAKQEYARQHGIENTPILKTSKFLTIANPQTAALISTIKATQQKTDDKDTFTGVTSVEKKNEKWNIPILGETGNEGLQWIQRNLYDGAQKELVANGWLKQTEYKIQTGTQTPNIIRQTLGITPETQVEVLTITKTTKAGDMVNQQTIKDKQNSVVVSPQKNDLLYMNIGENGTIKPDVIKTFAPSVLIRDIDDWNGKIVANALGEDGINKLYSDPDIQKNIAAYRKGLTTEKAKAVAEEILSFNITGNPLADGLIMVASGGIVGFETKIVEKVGMKGLAEATKVANAIKATGKEFKAANIALPQLNSMAIAHTIMDTAAEYQRIAQVLPTQPGAPSSLGEIALSLVHQTNILSVPLTSPRTIAKVFEASSPLNEVLKTGQVVAWKPTKETAFKTVNDQVERSIGNPLIAKAFVNSVPNLDRSVVSAVFKSQIASNPVQFSEMLSDGVALADNTAGFVVKELLTRANVDFVDTSMKFAKEVAVKANDNPQVAASILFDASRELGSTPVDLMVKTAIDNGAPEYNTLVNALENLKYWNTAEGKGLMPTGAPIGATRGVSIQQIELTAIMNEGDANKLAKANYVTYTPTGKVRTITDIHDIAALDTDEIKALSKETGITETKLKDYRIEANNRLSEVLDNEGNPIAYGTDIGQVKQEQAITAGMTTREAGETAFSTPKSEAILADFRRLGLEQKEGKWIFDAKKMNELSKKDYDFLMEKNADALKPLFKDTTISEITNAALTKERKMDIIKNYGDVLIRDEDAVARVYAKNAADIEKEKTVIEKLSSGIHDQWSAWANDLMTTEQLSESRMNRWKPLVETKYEHLSDAMKQLDREQVINELMPTIRKITSADDISKNMDELTEKTYNQWSDWARTQMKSEKLSDNTTKRWKEITETPYKDLPDDTKEFFRKQVREHVLPAIDNTVKPTPITKYTSTPGKTKPIEAARSAIADLKKGDFEAAAKKLGDANSYKKQSLLAGKNADAYKDVSIAKIRRMEEFGAPKELVEQLARERANFALTEISKKSNDMKVIAFKINDGNVDKLTDLEAQKLWDEAKDLGLDATESAGKPNQLIKRLSDDAIKSGDKAKMEKLSKELKKKLDDCVKKGDCQSTSGGAAGGGRILTGTAIAAIGGAGILALTTNMQTASGKTWGWDKTNNVMVPMTSSGIIDTQYGVMTPNTAKAWDILQKAGISDTTGKKWNEGSLKGYQGARDEKEYICQNFGIDAIKELNKNGIDAMGIGIYGRSSTGKTLNHLVIGITDKDNNETYIIDPVKGMNVQGANVTARGYEKEVAKAYGNPLSFIPINKNTLGAIPKISVTKSVPRMTILDPEKGVIGTTGTELVGTEITFDGIEYKIERISILGNDIHQITTASGGATVASDKEIITQFDTENKKALQDAEKRDEVIYDTWWSSTNGQYRPKEAT